MFSPEDSPSSWQSCVLFRESDFCSGRVWLDTSEQVSAEHFSPDVAVGDLWSFLVCTEDFSTSYLAA